jgi:hypothetical protein
MPLITDNDVNVFLVLQEFPCLPLHFIAALLGKEPSTYQHKNGDSRTRYQYFRNRLAELRRAGYIKVLKNLRPRKGQKNRYDVYALDVKGRQELDARRLARPSMRLTNNSNHDLGSYLIAASFKLATMEDDRLGYILPQAIIDHKDCPPATKADAFPFIIPVKYWHRDRYVGTSKKHDYWPIGITFSTPTRKTRIRINIEYDRDTEGRESADAERSSMERHLRMILALLDDGYYKKHFGIPSFYVAIVSTTRERAEAWRQTLLTITKGKGHHLILFGVEPDWDTTQEYPKPDGHMLAQVWKRAGYTDLNMLEELGVHEKRAAA